MPEVLRLGVLAGEASGDNLGSGLMAALRRAVPVTTQIEFIGVGGAKMQALGLDSLADMSELTANGFVDPLLRLPQLLRLFRHLRQEFVRRELHAFIGIDFNVFNFLLEGALRKRGIRTVHYVSPSVYAWRRSRTARVANVAEMVLCLFPFEPSFYADVEVQAVFVGHPLADRIDLDAGQASARAAAREMLGLAPDKTVLALLPGSRSSEVRLMLPEFLQAARLFSQGHNAQVVIPCPRPALAELVQAQLAGDYADLPASVYAGDATQALLASDVALVKSGTSTLETMLLHRPMVVSYRLGRWSYQLARRLIRSPYVALPNILAGRQLVPELLQDAATGSALAQALDAQLQSSRNNPGFYEPFEQLHQQLRQGADASAAAAVLRLLGVASS